MNFSNFNSYTVIASTQELAMPEPLPIAPGPELLAYIKLELKERAVLCYCSSEFQ